MGTCQVPLVSFQCPCRQGTLQLSLSFVICPVDKLLVSGLTGQSPCHWQSHSIQCLTLGRAKKDWACWRGGRCQLQMCNPCTPASLPLCLERLPGDILSALRELRSRIVSFPWGEDMHPFVFGKEGEESLGGSCCLNPHVP